MLSPINPWRNHPQHWIQTPLADIMTTIIRASDRRSEIQSVASKSIILIWCPVTDLHYYQSKIRGNEVKSPRISIHAVSGDGANIVMNFIRWKGMNAELVSLPQMRWRAASIKSRVCQRLRRFYVNVWRTLRSREIPVVVIKSGTV